MLKGVLAASAAMFVCAPAIAGTVTIRYQGVVDHQTTPGIDPFVSLGDILTMTFRFDSDKQPREHMYDPMRAFAFDSSTGPEVFRAATDRGLEWLAGDDVNGTVLIYEKGQSPIFGTAFVRADVNDLPALMVNTVTGQFFIEEGGSAYGNFTPSLGFSGSLHLVELSDVPEPATWALMIAGFGLAGGAARVTRSGRRGSQPSTHRG